MSRTVLGWLILLNVLSFAGNMLTFMIDNRNRSQGSI